MRVSEDTKVISLARVPREEDKNQPEEAPEAPAEAAPAEPTEETP